MRWKIMFWRVGCMKSWLEMLNKLNWGTYCVNKWHESIKIWILSYLIFNGFLGFELSWNLNFDGFKTIQQQKFRNMSFPFDF